MNERIKTDGYRNTVAVIGAFDAVHCGHRALMEKALSEAKVRGLESILVTFDPLPGLFFGRLQTGDLILTREERLGLLKNSGFDRVIALSFDQTLASTSAEDFFELLKSKESVRLLVVGDDFALGKDRGGTVEKLRTIGRSNDCGVLVVPRLQSGGEAVSASRIRNLLKAGKMDEAARFLGYEYFFENEVIHGDARGRTIGIPTINQLIPDEKIVPPNGVYATKIEIKGRVFPAITNVGTRPTFKENDRIYVESYLLRDGDDFYGDRAKLSFTSFLRPEYTFPSAEALIKQIQQDIQRAQEILKI